ncbi:hypothetical protein F0562_018082 [Nyssa sinensis]|uniref:Uncharacterized protein n=1 Tax=Nyssa sinensis TaxID=561372 RepID=A0A5J4Z899_9ASTE|nr:hypothetical protein F0562_018082 [Nyssa sinensis]
MGKFINNKRGNLVKRTYLKDKRRCVCPFPISAVICWASLHQVNSMSANGVLVRFRNACTTCGNESAREIRETNNEVGLLLSPPLETASIRHHIAGSAEL